MVKFLVTHKATACDTLSEKCCSRVFQIGLYHMGDIFTVE